MSEGATSPEEIRHFFASRKYRWPNFSCTWHRSIQGIFIVQLTNFGNWLLWYLIKTKNYQNFLKWIWTCGGGGRGGTCSRRCLGLVTSLSLLSCLYYTCKINYTSKCWFPSNKVENICLLNFPALCVTSLALNTGDRYPTHFQRPGSPLKILYLL